MSTHPASPEQPFATILRHVGEKINLSSSEKDYFISLLQYRKFSRKSEILSPGEICKNQYFVIKGCLRVFYLDAEGAEHNAKFAIESWWAFDIESFLGSTPAFYGISCLEDTDVLMLNLENYNQLLERIPAFERFYRLLMQQSFIALQHRTIQSLSLSAEERYLRFQEKYPGLETRIAQKEIASYLGITPVFLSMLRRQELTKN